MTSTPVVNALRLFGENFDFPKIKKLKTVRSDVLTSTTMCKQCYFGGAAVAQWIRSRLPSCRPGFESQAHHLHFFQFEFKL